MAFVAAIFDIRTNQFYLFESPGCYLASHQVSAQSNLLLESRCQLKIFKMATLKMMATRVAILDTRTENFSNSESPFHFNASHQVSAQLVIPFGRSHLKIFKMAAKAAILAIGTR